LNYASHFEICKIAIAQKKFDEAINAIESAIFLNPKMATMYIKKGQIFARQKLYLEAIETYDRGIEYATDDKLVLYFDKGRMLRKLKRLDESIISFQLGVQHEPSTNKSLYCLGIMHLFLEDYTKAIFSIEKYMLETQIQHDKFVNILSEDQNFQSVLDRLPTDAEFCKNNPVLEQMLKLILKKKKEFTEKNST
jgi:tetratricopeptide (TPR) repeat protein